MKLTFYRMCSILAAKSCYENGQSVDEIAKAAKKSPATSRRFLKDSGVRMRS